MVFALILRALGFLCSLSHVCKSHALVSVCSVYTVVFNMTITRSLIENRSCTWYIFGAIESNEQAKQTRAKFFVILYCNDIPMNINMLPLKNIINCGMKSSCIFIWRYTQKNQSQDHFLNSTAKRCPPILSEQKETSKQCIQSTNRFLPEPSKWDIYILT